MKKDRGLSWLAAAAVLSFGVVALSGTRAAAFPTFPVPPVCGTKCSETQFNKKCSSGIYFYYTRATCSLCSGGTTNCFIRSTGSACMDHTDVMMIKIITSTEACPCVEGAVTYASVEAKSIDPGIVESTETPRRRCYD
jgi:hypothetical protein